MFKSGRAPISGLAELDRLAWKNAGAWGHEKVLTRPRHDLCFSFIAAHLQTSEMLCSVVFLQLHLVVAPLLTLTSHSDGTGASK